MRTHSKLLQLRVYQCSLWSVAPTAIAIRRNASLRAPQVFVGSVLNFGGRRDEISRATGRVLGVRSKRYVAKRKEIGSYIFQRQKPAR